MSKTHLAVYLKLNICSTYYQCAQCVSDSFPLSCRHNFRLGLQDSTHIQHVSEVSPSCCRRLQVLRCLPPPPHSSRAVDCDNTSKWLGKGPPTNPTRKPIVLIELPRLSACGFVNGLTFLFILELDCFSVLRTRIFWGQ